MTAARYDVGPRRTAGSLLALLLTPLLVASGCGDDPTGTTLVCSRAPRLVQNEPLEGELRPGDAAFGDAHIDYYAVELGDSVIARIELFSSDFDPLLLLFDPDGAVRAQAYDSVGAAPGEPETATLYRALGPGCHLLGAASWEKQGTGHYTLRADPAKTGPVD